MSLEPWVVGLVLVAALFHAAWNALAKASGDPLLGIALVMATSGSLALLGVPWVAFPDAAAWPYMMASCGLHFVYQLVLASAYRVGDLSQVYPIARGIAPCIVAVLALVFAGEVPNARQTAGLVAVTAAIASLTRTGASSVRSGPALGLALLTGLLIGAYTVVDGLAVRTAGAPERFIVWGFVLNAPPIVLWALARRGERVVPFLRAHGLRVAGGGVMGVVAYGIVLWALARGTMASVAAIRETSVILAALIGTQRLGEPFGPRRVAAAAVVALGVALVR